MPELLGPGVRVVTVEDVAELSDCVPNVVRLQARHANSEGVGEVGMESLVAATLRMRPDIVVGEVRALEGAAFIVAVNTGHARVDDQHPRGEPPGGPAAAGAAAAQRHGFTGSGVCA